MKEWDTLYSLMCYHASDTHAAVMVYTQWNLSVKDTLTKGHRQLIHTSKIKCCSTTSRLWSHDFMLGWDSFHPQYWDGPALVWGLCVLHFENANHTMAPATAKKKALTMR